MPELMAYGKAKGVKLILWVNSKNINSIGMDKLFATYAGWGASGVKIDFFSRNGSQATQRWQEELLACAAKHKLVVDFHGTYTPTGLSGPGRTSSRRKASSARSMPSWADNSRLRT